MSYWQHFRQTKKTQILYADLTGGTIHLPCETPPPLLALRRDHMKADRLRSLCSTLRSRPRLHTASDLARDPVLMPPGEAQQVNKSSKLCSTASVSVCTRHPHPQDFNRGMLIFDIVESFLKLYCTLQLLYQKRPSCHAKTRNLHGTR